MNNSIRIENDNQLKGRWLRINIPYTNNQPSTASIQHMNGTVMKVIELFEGNNAIDVSNINENVINLKIETPFETLLREIRL